MTRKRRPATASGQKRFGDQPGADVGRVVAGVARRPQQPDPVRHALARRRSPVPCRGRAGSAASRRPAPRRPVRARRTGARTWRDRARAGGRAPRRAPTRSRSRRRPTPRDGRAAPRGRRPSRRRRRRARAPRPPRESISSSVIRSSALAERRLPVLGEDLLDRLAEPLLDHAVDVHGGPAQRPRDAVRGGRLAGPHEADADDAAGVGQGSRHPIRSL